MSSGASYHGEDGNDGGSFFLYEKFVERKVGFYILCIDFFMAIKIYF